MTNTQIEAHSIRYLLSPESLSDMPLQTFQSGRLPLFSARVEKQVPVHATQHKNKIRNDMIIFSGLGFLPIAFLILFGIAFGAGHQGGASHDSGLASALFFAGIASGLSGWWLHNRPARTVIDKATGKELVLRRRHALFFVPLMYWGPIFIAMAIYQFCTVQR